MARYKEYGYDIQNGRAIIPERATEIEVEAFMNCEELKSITIPPSVTKIWHSAFSGCSSLTSISIPPIGDEDWGRGFLCLLQSHEHLRFQGQQRL